MPIYEYRCENCNHELELIQKMSDAPLTECPECHQPKLKKLISAAGFRLKGSGWYQTDFKNSGSKPPKTDKKEEKSDGKISDSKKTETKTESKADSKAGSGGDGASSKS